MAAYLDIGIVLGSGLIAGFINTFAGNGSAVTLAALIGGVGLDPLVANATNRLGILGHGSVATPTYITHHGLDRKKFYEIIPALGVGALLGAWLSVHGSADWFVWVYRLMLFVLLGVVLLRPKRWLRPSHQLNTPTLLRHVVFFGLGIYGAYIQMGMGIIFLAVLVLIEGLPLIRANSLKLLTVLLYTIPLVIYLAWSGLVSWHWGLIMLAGQVCGGWISAQYVSRWRHADRLAYYLLVIIIVVTLAHQGYSWWSEA